MVSGAVPGYPRFEKCAPPDSFSTRLEPTTNSRVGRWKKTLRLNDQ